MTYLIILGTESIVEPLYDLTNSTTFQGLLPGLFSGPVYLANGYVSYILHPHGGKTGFDREVLWMTMEQFITQTLDGEDVLIREAEVDDPMF